MEENNNRDRRFVEKIHIASTQDLMQMFVYNDYWKSVQAMLLYPSMDTVAPDFKSFKDRKHQCAVGRLNILKEGKLKTEIGREILD
ncbi:hypothetical protein [Gramella sp. AN32]|uniref:Uncharacterized protein n=1 Tax=Christiangramia antarctica TaxID=2058158 RepID=A0ABW5X6R2_9FLAO|nr:hypothetical protein [Gramella sp. AN32]